MKYLSRETCQLLEKLGCVSEGDHWYKNNNFTHQKDLDSICVDTLGQTNLKKVCRAFTFEDLTVKENAVKIWGEKTRCSRCLKELGHGTIRAEEHFQSKNTSCVQDDVLYGYVPASVHLLRMKLNGKDWEAVLLDHLKGKQ